MFSGARNLQLTALQVMTTPFETSCTSYSKLDKHLYWQEADYVRSAWCVMQMEMVNV